MSAFPPKPTYRTRAIISRGLYIFYPIFKDHFFVLKEVFSENSALMYGLYSRASSNQERLIVARERYINMSNGQKFESLISCYIFSGGCDRGTCVSFTGHHFCICDPGWRGSNCNKCTPYWACPNQSDSACNQPNECICDTGEPLCNNPALSLLGTF